MTEDWWPQIDKEIGGIIIEAHRLLHAVMLTPIMERRFRAGELEYRGDWLTRPPEWFDEEALAEAADLLIYLSMRRIRQRQLHD